MLLAFRPSASVHLKRFSNSGIPIITGMELVAATPAGVAGMRKKSGMRATSVSMSRIEQLLRSHNPAAFILSETYLTTIPGIHLMVELMMKYPAIPVLMEVNRNTTKTAAEHLLRVGVSGLYIRKEPRWFGTWTGLSDALPLQRGSAQEMRNLREQIDHIDVQLINLLLKRDEITARLGHIKVHHKQTIFQSGRWKAIDDQVRQASGSDKYLLLHEVFALIHAHAIAQQAKL